MGPIRMTYTNSELRSSFLLVAGDTYSHRETLLFQDGIRPDHALRQHRQPL